MQKVKLIRGNSQNALLVGEVDDDAFAYALFCKRRNRQDFEILDVTVVDSEFGNFAIAICAFNVVGDALWVDVVRGRVDTQSAVIKFHRLLKTLSMRPYFWASSADM